MDEGLEPGARPRPDRVVLVRDSKDHGGPLLEFSQAAWRRFVIEVRRGRYDGRWPGFRGP
jgi:hypothetical protein